MDRELADLAGRLRAAGSVFAEREAEILAEYARRPDFEEMVRRRESGEPLEYVVGWAELGGRRWPVRPGVFVPRRRTLPLIDAAVRHGPKGGWVLDIGCGCGVLGHLVADAVGGDLIGVDRDPVAVECAQAATAPQATESRSFAVGDLFEPVPKLWRGRVDVLLAHLPYVATAELAWMPREAHYEDPITLDGGPDGLDELRRLAASVCDWLAPEGRLWTQVAVRQRAAAVRLLAEAGLRVDDFVDDDGDLVISASLPHQGEGA